VSRSVWLRFRHDHAKVKETGETKTRNIGIIAHIDAVQLIYTYFQIGNEADDR
jgi:hypothetical protein